MKANPMADFHHNVFYYYKGAKETKEELYDHQLEDNTTKALTNTLIHTSPIVATKFLEEFLGLQGAGKLEIQLQKKTIGKEKISRRSQRLLFGLQQAEIQQDPLATNFVGPVEGESRPDAWLYGEDYVVLVESKVGGTQLEPEQMERHFQKLQVESLEQPKRTVRTWNQIHQFFVGMLSELNGMDKWLVGQFTQYLEWKGMSEFTGFEEWIFDFFVHIDKDPETKRLVRDIMRSLAEKILRGPNGLRDFAPSFYKEFHVGNFGAEDDHYWVAFGPGDPDFKQVAHQTISIYDYGLDVFVNVELLPAINRLRKKLQSEKRKFKEVVSALPEPFTVQVEERKSREHQPRTYDCYLIAKLEGGTRRHHHPGVYGLKDPQS
jgi:hypothetical protein